MDGIFELPEQTIPTRLPAFKIPYLLHEYDRERELAFLQDGEHHPLTSSQFKDLHGLSQATQSWLFFGLLRAFLDISKLEHEDFLEGDVVSVRTRASSDHFTTWRARVFALPSRERTALKVKAAGLLRRSFMRSDEVDDLAVHLQPSLTERPEGIFPIISLSVKLLLALLHAVLLDTFEEPEPISGSLRLSSPWRSKNLDRVLDVRNMTFSQANRYFFMQSSSLVPLPPGDETGGPATALLRKRFVEHAWCPAQATHICKTQDFLTANELASRIRLDKSPYGHKRCTVNLCLAYQVDTVNPERYPYKGCGPFGASCSCEMIGPTLDELKSKIDKDQIPLIAIKQKGEIKKIKLVAATSTSRYVAVSHIWSDGRGNPACNTIRRCQLEAIRDDVVKAMDPRSNTTLGPVLRWYMWIFENLPSFYQYMGFRVGTPGKPWSTPSRTTLFLWMDTLCIPAVAKPRESMNQVNESDSQALRSHQEAKSLKKKTMAHITPIFAGADFVFILDRYLQNMTFTAHPNVWNLAHIIYSANWMLRGWPLEEGFLAQICVFQTNQKAYKMNMPEMLLPSSQDRARSPLTRVSSKQRISFALQILRTLGEERRQLTRARRITGKTKAMETMLYIPRFIRAWNELVDRTTTERGDAFIILANLLDFGLYDTLEMADEERIPWMIASCEQLPLSLMFNRGQRLQIAGVPQNGWMPTSIKGADRLLGQSWLTRVNLKSLHVTELLLEETDPANSSLVIVLLAAGSWSSNAREFTVTDQCRHRNMICELQDKVLPQQANKASTPSMSIHCAIFDLMTGSESLRGYLAQGAIFLLIASSPDHLVLQYEAPLIAKTEEQWRRAGDRPSSPYATMFNVPAYIESTTLDTERRITIQFDASLWVQPLWRRPAYSSIPRISLIIGGSFLIVILAGFIGILVVFSLPSVRESWGNIGGAQWSLIIAYVVFMFLFYNILERRLAVHNYTTWMKTYDAAYAVKKRKSQKVKAQLTHSGRRDVAAPEAQDEYELLISSTPATMPR